LEVLASKPMPKPCILYYITDRKAFPGDELTRRRYLLDKIAEAGSAGINYIQLREKDLPTRDLESLAREASHIISQLRTKNREPRTALLINSRTDVALATNAAGVHLPANDISPAEVQRILKSATQCGAGALARKISPLLPQISISCHSPEEVTEAASNQATVALFAPVFEKKDALGFISAGLNALHQACRAKIPVLALGGITLQNAASCLQAGAAGIAAIRLFQENRIADIARILRGS
jgi:thiamine-phosphate pyrophosphorylase